MPSSTQRWALAIPVAAILAAGGLVGLLLVRYGPLDGRPWGYVFFALAALGAVAALLLAVVRAREVTEEPPG